MTDNRIIYRTYSDALGIIMTIRDERLSIQYLCY